MFVMIANEVTGEVVSTDTVHGLGQIRGVIRSWMASGLNIHQFNVLEWSEYRLWQYLREYAWQYMISECDVCKAPRKNSDLEWLDDNHEVCLMTLCKDGCK